MGTVRTILKLFSISLGMCLSARIIEGPKTAFVLLNTDATFNCTVSRPWSIIIWIMNKTPVLTVVQDGPVITDPQFGQRNYTTGNTFTSELIISAVTLKNNATVMCSLQTDGSQQADLFVQVDGMVSFASTISSVVLNHSTDIICKAEGWNPVPTVSWTINETVVDSKMYTTTFQASSGHLYNALSTLNLTLSASAKVVCLATIKVLPQPKTAALIITVRQQSSYQKEIRKMSTKKSLETNVDGHRNSGLDNFGMSTESVNDFQSSSGFPSPNQVDTWSSDTMETPVVPASNRGSQKPTLNEYMMAFSNYPRKTRHVTAV
ncbi:immunoglobulin superfamily member 5-like isoform X2 [Heterodontus francisci]|uniref:immunoglobulin superfamily member 5-like isoform X2 n=1 Tax=Heterodontus francisci TaxID=7792 RepID=UPI00355BD270